ncbi:MAG TPA: ComF family protein [Candidatus Binataceae bacterium]|nr:ComF family protein [Candidatus Binataceae bacterium]
MDSAPMLHYLVNFLYPPRCPGCGARLPVDTTARVCTPCLAGIEPIPAPFCAVCGVPLDAGANADSRWCDDCVEAPPHFGRARAVARYSSRGENDSGTVASIIRRHKYGLDQSLAHALAECLGNELPLPAADYDLVIPVPLHSSRLRWRGFNQAAMLAIAVGRRGGRTVDLKSLVRVRATPPQTMQNQRDRRANLRDAFAVRRPARVANRGILLIDDVMTTGATANECARTLLAAGARRVDVLTLARAL